jgi:two-component system cell cycle response regulator CpdR
MWPPSVMDPTLWRAASGDRLPGTPLRGARSHSMGRRALVVDDDAQVLELVASMLEELGCETLLARSGTEALGTIANDQTIEILIADATMPGLEGSDLAARARRVLPEVKVVLMSGGEADGRGFPLLRKPFTEHDLRRFMAETM